MRLGQGFNSFTQQICLDKAVSKGEPKLSDNTALYVEGVPAQGVSQKVSYSSRFVQRISDVTNSMNVSAALSIQTGQIGGTASGTFIDSDKFKESDLNFFIQVNVVNQEHMAWDYEQFQMVKGLNAGNFNEIYGDCFIAGWEEGGDFNALISVKVKDKSKTTNIAASLEAKLGTPALSGSVKGEGKIDKAEMESNTETSISVNWSGGGQIKQTNVIWDIDSLTLAAVNFPDLVAMTPQRKTAILAKYTTLKDFREKQPGHSPVDYEMANFYSSMLLDVYTDYKSLWKTLQSMNWDVQNSTSSLAMASPSAEISSYIEHWTGRMRNSLSDDSDPPEDGKQAVVMALKESVAREEGTPETKKDVALQRRPPLYFSPKVYSPYPATIVGLLQARTDCRAEMIKVVNEVDLLAEDPTIALQADRESSALSPAIFKELLPSRIVPVSAKLYSFEQSSLRKEALQSLLKYEYLGGSHWMGTSPDVPGEAGESSDVFFNDLDELTAEDQPEKLYIEAMDKVVSAIQMSYTNGKVVTHRIRQCNNAGDARSATLTWDRGNDPVRADGVLIRAHNYDGRTLVDLVNASGYGHAHISALVTAPAATTSNDYKVSHHGVPSGWDLVGFWGYLAPSKGFSGLGIIERQMTQKVNSTKLPPLFEDHGADDLRDDIKRYWADRGLKGRYFRLSKCAGIPTAEAAPFGQLRRARTTKIAVATERGLITNIHLLGEDGRVLVEPPEPTHGVIQDKDALIIPLGSASKISQVVIKIAKEVNEKTDGPVCAAYLEISHSIEGTPSPFKVGTDPGASAPHTVVAARPQDAESGQKWAFRGFYGAHGGFVDRLGVVWARE
ncbi:hypothetical protein LTS10_008102 [Elasticomyces elasticus]|nr:hypothetical protein LTS10_008102 [Elasticomyces elasticus]